MRQSLRRLAPAATAWRTPSPSTAAAPSNLQFTRIEDGLFYECRGLTSVTLPASVTSIGDEAFSRCERLTSIIPDSVTSIGKSAFSSCDGLTSMNLEPGLATVSHLMFSRCTGLTSVTIPASVTYIGEYAFESCSGLTSVTLQPGLATIGAGMFRSCSGLTSVTIPESVTTIGSFAFYIQLQRANQRHHPRQCQLYRLPGSVLIWPQAGMFHGIN